MGDTSFNDDVLYAALDDRPVNSVLLKPSLQHTEVPLAGVSVFISSILDVVVGPLVYRVVGQMDEALVQVLWVVRVFLSGEPNQPLLEQEDLERFEAGDEHVNAQVVLKAVDEVGVRNILRDYVPVLFVDLRLLADHLDAFAARTRCRLHNVHVLVPRAFALQTELAVVFRENVSFGAEVEVV